MQKIIIAAFILSISAGLTACDEKKGAAQGNENSILKTKYVGPTGPVVRRTYDEILAEQKIKDQADLAAQKAKK